MRGRWVAAGLLAAAALAYALPARAGDTVRLNQVQDVPAQRLVDDGQGADTVPVWHRGFGYGGWGGGWGRGFGYGGFGGYRGFGWGGYRGFGGLGYGLGYRGFGYGLGGYGLGYRGFGYGLGYRGFGYGLGGYGLGGYGLGYGLGWRGIGYGGWGGYGLGGYGLGYGGLGGWGYPGIGMGYWGCSGLGGSTITLGIAGPAVIETVPLYSEVIEETPLAPAPGDGTLVPSDPTYPYDGGPAAPQVAPDRANRPATPAPATERAISLPKKAKKLTYPAYGEQRQRKTAPSGTLLTRDS